MFMGMESKLGGADLPESIELVEFLQALDIGIHQVRSFLPETSTIGIWATVSD
jgi:hypothetical protein